MFAQGHPYAAWKVKSDVGKKTLGEVVHAKRKGTTASANSSLDEKVNPTQYELKSESHHKEIV